MTCAICSTEAETEVWGTPLCQAHFHEWWAMAPYPAEVEREAQKSPKADEVIERVVKHESLPDSVVLKPGVLEKYLTNWTRKWAKAKASTVAA